VPDLRAQTVLPDIAQQVNHAYDVVHQSPRDARKRFELAEILRKSGDLKKASVQYLETTLLDPSYYLAYHQLLSCKPTNDQLDEGIERLEKLDQEHPQELMLRVALSELLEQRGETYKAARALVDLQFVDAVPTKYSAKINARVRYLMGKVKDAQTTEKAQQTVQPTADDLDAVPIPLPDTTASTDFYTDKLKDTRTNEGYGHTKLLP
jgi:DNA-binding SARP family transcriptional activator